MIPTPEHTKFVSVCPVNDGCQWKSTVLDSEPQAHEAFRAHLAGHSLSTLVQFIATHHGQTERYAKET